MTKETGGIESDDRERGWKEQCSVKKNEGNNWRKIDKKHDIQEGDVGESDSKQGGGKWDRRGEKYMWQDMGMKMYTIQ